MNSNRRGLFSPLREIKVFSRRGQPPFGCALRRLWAGEKNGE
jgi:hypothetical protein